MRYVIIILIALVALDAYIRLAPSDPAKWHVDPLTAATPQGNGWLVRPDGGNAAPKVRAATPEALLAALDKIIRATPRTSVLAGSVGEGRITYVTRSALWGFPDYTTISAVAQGDGAVPVIYARQRFGSNDWGVNKARVEGWLTQLDATLP
ncbi:MAG: DUF1499 domain-containing protein [Limimaricola sp.]|uniref:DUF1499 domain-containing protein n=1 Tax=Limimaricola sp. TaxID=2211665 RepID=UPI001E13E45C|nr:DUF1499 domain-containing protein [Limimaricola sp.]MBI1418298.1 DUF1499 domain-containing protein [Limimaricola sp.]